MLFNSCTAHRKQLEEGVDFFELDMPNGCCSRSDLQKCIRIITSDPNGRNNIIDRFTVINFDPCIGVSAQRCDFLGHRLKNSRFEANILIIISKLTRRRRPLTMMSKRPRAFHYTRISFTIHRN